MKQALTVSIFWSIQLCKTIIFFEICKQLNRHKDEAINYVFAYFVALFLCCSNIVDMIL